jgi:hypothetical protein
MSNTGRGFDLLGLARFAGGSKMAIVKVVMIETAEGSEDGIVLRIYEARRVYDMADRLAVMFVRNGKARYVTDEPAPAERKVVGPAETKVVAPAETKIEIVTAAIKPKRRVRK